MLVVISPAKIQNFKSPAVIHQYSLPHFMDEAGELVRLMQQLSPRELAQLLDINTNLSYLNTDRHLNWHQPFTPHNARQAVLVFDGEVYRGLDAKTLAPADVDYMQTHLRLFSGLYGLLRPLDLIQPYRIDVSSRLQNPFGKDLYAFWKERITLWMNQCVREAGKPEVIVNLASAEYIKTLDRKKLQARIIDIEFYQYKEDKLKQIVIYTKKARGMMARYILQNRLTEIEDLKGFGAEDYWFEPNLSTNDKLVFVR